MNSRMASSPTIQTWSITHTSFPCSSNIRIQSETGTDGEVSRTKLRLNKGHALLRRQFHKSIVFHPQKNFKRRFTFPGNHEHKILCKKRRRFTSVALPTKFLLGGNINDPLNLRSLEDENVNQQMNSLTPVSSPMPISRRGTQVQVLIPPNIYDPLNLNTGEEIEFNLLSNKHRKRKRHRKNRRDDFENVVEKLRSEICEPDPSCEQSVTTEDQNPVCQREKSPEIVSSSESLSNIPEDRITDKIVSPVVPQGSPAKFFKRYHLRSFSKDTEEKVSPYKQITKRRRSKTRLQHADYIKFRANAQKFCYGNHIVKWDSSEIADQRLHILSKNLFYDKDVMDIGCNAGELTLYIARHWSPHKVIGIDIDKRLVNIAQRRLRMFKSRCVSENIDFPQAMAVMYGPLAKFGFLNQKSSHFPNNVSFFEANYVPGCEEYLETQKPEFDVILCLRVTKWIHLNFGDNGLKMAFKRMYAQLKNGGHLILEPQPWFTYSASKRITPSIYKTYCSLEMKPENFCEFLMSKEIGFSSCEMIGRIYNNTKVYRQPLYLLTKGFETSCRRNIQRDVLSSIPFHSDQWNHNSDEQGACSLSESGFSSSYNTLNHPDTQH